MKSIAVFVLIFILQLSVYSISAQVQQNNSYVKTTIVEGKIFGSSPFEKIILNRNNNLIESRLLYVGTSETDTGGNFKIKFHTSVIGDILFYYKGLSKQIFIEPGDSLHISYFEKQDSFVFSGKGAEANNFRTEFVKTFWDEKFYTNYPLIRKSSPQIFKGYCDSMTIVQKDYYALHKTATLIQTNFDNFFQTQLKYYFGWERLNYAAYYTGTTQKNFQELITDSSFYDFINEIKISDDDCSVTPSFLNYCYWLSGYFTKVDRKKYGWRDEKLKNIFWQKDYQIAKEKFKGDALDFTLAKILYTSLYTADLDSISNLFEDYEKICINRDYYDYISMRYSLMKNSKNGLPAYDFSLKDSNGNIVSLHDFKGKVVYIDFSASWCGPCRQEIPFENKLIEELKDKNVIFLFIAVEEKLYPDFSSLIIENEKAIHLYAPKAFNDATSLAYNVRSIPHFVLIDENGMIAKADAKRPSNGAKEEIEELLK